MHRLLIAATTWSGGHERLHASHAWRERVNSFIVTNGLHPAELRRHFNSDFNTSEIWYEHPDFVSPECKGCAGEHTHNTIACPRPAACGWCGQTGNGCRYHEQKYVLTPSLANVSFGNSYDWMLIADAETVWFADNIIEMLKNVNPNDPWYFSESMFPTSNSNCVFPGKEPIVKDGCVYSPAPDPLCTQDTIIQPENCAWHTAQDKTGKNRRASGQVWAGTVI